MLQLSQSGTWKAESSVRYFTHGSTFNQLRATFSLQVDFEKQDVLFPYAVTGWRYGLVDVVEVRKRPSAKQEVGAFG